MLTRGAQTLTWDAENRLASVVSGTTTTTFAYDAKGARVSKSASGGSTTHYINRYFEKDITTGEATKHYFLGGRTIAVKKGADALQYVLNEHLGSTAVTADGTSSRTTKYAPYGTTRSESGTGPLGASSPTERRYTGQRLDTSTGFYWYSDGKSQGRPYDPGLGRWLQPDNIVPDPSNPQSLNRYSYVANNPLKRGDKDGHCAPACAVPLAFGPPGWALAGGALTVYAVVVLERETHVFENLGRSAASWFEERLPSALGQQATGEAGAIPLGTGQTSPAPDSGVLPIQANWPTHLPKAGERPYSPPKDYHGRVERNRAGHYVDREGNIWEWKSRERGGEPPHWDVQHRDGSHTNVLPDGKVWHGPDNFPNQPRQNEPEDLPDEEPIAE